MPDRIPTLMVVWIWWDGHVEFPAKRELHGPMPFIHFQWRYIFIIYLSFNTYDLFILFIYLKQYLVFWRISFETAEMQVWCWFLSSKHLSFRERMSFYFRWRQGLAPCHHHQADPDGHSRPSCQRQSQESCPSRSLSIIHFKQSWIRKESRQTSCQISSSFLILK